MSAYSQLQGLYPPGTGMTLQDNQTALALPPGDNSKIDDVIKKLGNNALPERSQVFPIKILDVRDHTYYLHDYPNCKGVNEIRQKNLKKKVIKDLVDQYQLTYGSFFSNNYNYKDLTYDQIYKISDAFVSGYTEQLTYPEFENAKIKLDDFFKKSLEVVQIDMLESIFGDADTNYYLGRMSMSPTMRSILEWMDTRINYDASGKGYVTYKAPKLVMYSGHDTNIAAMLSLLKASFPEFKKFDFPTFACSLFLELSKTDGAESKI
jgi:hypothetical protein